MAIKLNGLSGKALLAASHIERLNKAYDAFNEAAPAHAIDVESLTPQITEMQDDLTFAAQTLGNSVAGSNAGTADKPKDPPVEKHETATAEVIDIVSTDDRIAALRDNQFQARAVPSRRDL